MRNLRWKVNTHYSYKYYMMHNLLLYNIYIILYLMFDN